MPINPLTTNGTETWPIGYADIFSSLKETLMMRAGEEDDEETGRVPLERAREVRENNAVRTRGFGRRENVCAVLFQTEPRHASISGLKPPKAKCVSQNRDTKEIFGFLAVEGLFSRGSVRRGERRVCEENTTGIRNWKEIENVVYVQGGRIFVFAGKRSESEGGIRSRRRILMKIGAEV